MLPDETGALLPIQKPNTKLCLSFFCLHSLPRSSHLHSFTHAQTAIMSAALGRLCRAAQDFYKLWQHNVTGKADMLAAPSLGAGEEAVRRSVT
jgi:hypothetical protein